MTTRFRFILYLTLTALVFSSCVSKKRKRGEDVSKFNKFYHNLNSKYNGIFNANELLVEGKATLEATYKDDYSQILPVFPYIASPSAKSIAPQMDIVIEKVTRVAMVHEVGEYVDDSYVMMGKAQFLKHDWETAEETFEYFREEFNPNNPYGRGYVSKKKSRKQIKKEREEEKKAREKAREEQKKAREEEKKARKEAKEAERKAREEARKQREKEKKAERKRRKKNRKKSSRKRGRRGSKKRPEKKETAPAPIDTTQQTKKKEIKKVQPVVEKEKEEPEVIAEEENDQDKKKEDPQDKTEYSEGLLWLAKTYIERDNFSSAEYILRQLEKKNVKKHVRVEIAPTLAHLYIRKGELEKAVPYLDSAIEATRDKTAKARYSYIIGQIEQQLGNRDRAMQAFAKVDDYRPSFDMKVNAELAEMQYAMASGQRSAESVLGSLDKMLKEAKYKGYEDRIYYTIANIKREQGLVDEALAAYTQSNLNNTGSPSLKAESYYAMATMTFEREDYLSSKYYYDSTLQVIQATDRRYDEVKTLSDNLKDIAYNIEVVLLQDSLIALSQLSDKDLRDKAIELAEASEKEQENNGKVIVESAPKSGAGDRIFGTSDNWPYNLKRVERGKKKFREKWGDIPLVDNWRRSAAIQAVADRVEDGEGQEQEATVSEKAIQEVLKSIPRNPNDVVDAERKLQKALYDLGVLYRDKLQVQDKSIATLQELIERFPDTEHKLDAYYNIYLSHLDLNNDAEAKRYLALIQSEFGDTRIAKQLANPDAADKMTEEERLLAYYEDTYQLFERGKFDEVSERVNTASSAFDNDYGLKPKFALLNAMSLGKLNGKEAYKAALSDLITRHENTDEARRAKEILRFLKGDDEAFEQLDIKEVDNIFKQEDERRHYILLVTKGASNDEFIRAKIAVSDYNKKYHKLARLQLNESFLDKDAGTRLLLIRNFDNKSKALKYYNEVIKSTKEFLGRDDLEFELYAATQGNYRRIIQERSTKKYKVFFEKYYLGKED